MEILLHIKNVFKQILHFFWQEERVKPMHSSVSMDGKL